jgi:hypothetical protein
MYVYDIHIEARTAAFEGAAQPAEIARILRDLASRIAGGDVPPNLRDHNGNHVGYVTIDYQP